MLFIYGVLEKDQKTQQIKPPNKQQTDKQKPEINFPSYPNC